MPITEIRIPIEYSGLLICFVKIALCSVIQEGKRYQMMKIDGMGEDFKDKEVIYQINN